MQEPSFEAKARIRESTIDLPAEVAFARNPCLEDLSDTPLDPGFAIDGRNAKLLDVLPGYPCAHEPRQGW